MHTINLGASVTRVHMIGAGGVSMSGLAEILWRDGYQVSGSDEIDSDATRHLRSLGMKIALGNAAENIPETAELVVYTAAVTPDNPEYRAALKRGLRLIDRASLLALIMAGYQHTVCVAGTHGKTTTTSIIADLCLTAGLDPTISLGGYMGDGFNFRVGGPGYFVMEACEYFDSFLHWRPRMGVILNIDDDHMDYFGTVDRLIDSFAQFAQNIAPDGTLIIYGATRGLASVMARASCRVVTYGTAGADFTAQRIQWDEDGRPTFDLCYLDRPLTRLKLPLHGEHNILNALAAAAAGYHLGLSAEALREGLSAARGTRRRYEYKGVFNGASIVDDYAHHPTEISCALSAARTALAGKTGRLFCAFQPHTYSRTKHLLEGFARAFSDADRVLLLPIFASREAFHKDGVQKSVTSEDLAQRMAENGQAVYCAKDFDDAAQWLRQQLIPGDLLITMGAGDVYILGERLLHTDLSTLSTTPCGYL